MPQCVHSVKPRHRVVETLGEFGVVVSVDQCHDVEARENGPRVDGEEGKEARYGRTPQRPVGDLSQEHGPVPQGVGRRYELWPADDQKKEPGNGKKPRFPRGDDDAHRETEKRRHKQLLPPRSNVGQLRLGSQRDADVDCSDKGHAFLDVLLDIFAIGHSVPPPMREYPSGERSSLRLFIHTLSLSPFERTGAGEKKKMDNIVLLTDSYKVSHYLQYPPKTSKVYSYFESRGGVYNETVFFGLQYLIKKHLLGEVVTMEKIDQAEDYYTKHFPPGFKFYREGWEHILREHGGRLPLSIKAVPEGSVVPVKNVLLTIENTDPLCYWLTNFVETLLVQVWYPMTVATHSREQKKVIAAYLRDTGGEAGLGFKLHDFGFRGVSSVETAGIGGAAHLVNFMGTDTIAGLVVAREYYGESMAGFSIPASEHSTITSWGKENEVDAMKNMLASYPNGLVACVSDSFDIFKACGEYWGERLKDSVLSRDGCLVVRPDSGDPPTTALQVLEILGEKLGKSKNDQDFYVLDPHVRVIWGDGIDYDMLVRILSLLKENGWSADNIAFGSGGGLLQKLNRDTQKCAFKCSAAVVDGQTRDVYKDPVTDHGKVSKKGLLALVKDESGQYTTVAGPSQDDCLVEVFRDGNLLQEYTFAQVRENAALPPLSDLPLPTL